MRDRLEAILRESAAVKLATLASEADTILAAVRAGAEALRRGGKLLFFGNGGSAADAQHLAAEFVNRLSRERRPLAALALTTDSSALTAIANDREYAEVFARQIEALGRPEDLAVAISTSGNSPSVIRAAQVARRLGLGLVGLTGESGGRLATEVDILIRVPSRSTQRVQEAHITIGHALCELIEAALFSELPCGLAGEPPALARQP
jgi:D-sedoheptulose 7-phosphate isomerase